MKMPQDLLRFFPEATLVKLCRAGISHVVQWHDPSGHSVHRMCRSLLEAEAVVLHDTGGADATIFSITAPTLQ